MTTTDPIIDMPRLRTQLVKLRDWLMTALWWIFWLYLIREVFTITVDLVAARSDAIRMQAVAEIAGTFAFYFQIILINGLMLILWARYNRFRFRGKDRRSAKSSVSQEEIAESLEMSVALVKTAQRARRMIVHHDGLGLIEQIDVAPGDAMTLDTRTSLGSGSARTGASGAGSRSRALRPPTQGTRGLTAGLAKSALGAASSSRSKATDMPPDQTIVSKPLATTAPDDDERTTVSKLEPTSFPDDEVTTVSKLAPASPDDDQRTTVSKFTTTDDEMTTVSKGAPNVASDVPLDDEVTTVSKPLPKPSVNDSPPR